MPSPNTDGGWILPDPIDGDRICIVVPVPNVQGHRAAFLGALWDLTRWFNWQRDGAHTAVLAAAVWNEIFEGVAVQFDDAMALICGDNVVDVRQNETDPCILEKTTNGVTWVPFADLRLCAPLLRVNPATGQIEQSTDGLTWFEVPDGPYVPNAPEATTFQPPPRTESEAETRRCLAAANAANVLVQTYTEMAHTLAESAAVTALGLIEELAALVNGFLLLIGVPAASGPITLLTIAGIAAAEAEYAANPLTSTDEEELACALYECAIDNAGSITFDFACFQSKLTDAVGTPKDNLVSLILFAIGGDGLNMAGTTTAISTYDCSGCDLPPVEMYIANVEGGFRGTQLEYEGNGWWHIRGTWPGGASPFQAGWTSGVGGDIELATPFYIEDWEYIETGDILSAGYWQVPPTSKFNWDFTVDPSPTGGAFKVLGESGVGADNFFIRFKVAVP